MSEGSNVTAICTFNKNVIDIRNKTDDLMKCLNTSDIKDGSICIDCLKEFNLIANKYKQLSESSNGICFDVVDQVKNKSMNCVILFNCFVFFFTLSLSTVQSDKQHLVW